MQSTLSVSDKKSIRKKIASAVIAAIQDGRIAFEEGSDLAEYIDDVMPYVKTLEDAEDLMQELQLDFDVDTRPIVSSLRSEGAKKTSDEKDEKSIRDVTERLKVLGGL